jgi:hypothetical protein
VVCPGINVTRQGRKCAVAANLCCCAHCLALPARLYGLW